MNKRKAIFIDRDGTLIEEVNFLHRVEDLRLFDYTNEAVRLLKERGFLVIIATNQSGIGRIEQAVHLHDHDAIATRITRRRAGTFDP